MLIIQHNTYSTQDEYHHSALSSCECGPQSDSERCDDHENGADEISRLRCMLFMFSSWNFVNETGLTENFATPIICLVTFHFNQLPLLRISQGENQESSTLASTLA